MAIGTPGQQPATANNRFHYWRDPGRDELGDNAADFLERLPGPTHIHLSGVDTSRCRFVTTLLHGNEPSGLHAVFALLQEGVRPALDCHILIPSVAAAKQAPGFHYRMLPGQKDINRCFRTPVGDAEQDRLAGEILQKFEDYQPECVIDIHNTSGSSPSFGVATFIDERHDALVALFTHRLIVSEIKLGALMETSSAARPVVTIECGGAGDPASHLLATKGLKRYLEQDDVLTSTETDTPLELFHNPVRLELKDGREIAYGRHPLTGSGVTLVSDIEDHNFGYVGEEDRLGFVSGALADNLIIRGARGEMPADRYFCLRDGVLFPARRLKLFMVTTNPVIARKDCLFYLVTAE